MDEQRFDRLALGLAQGAPRRNVARALATGLLAAWIGSDIAGVAAKRKKKKKKKKPVSPPGCVPSCAGKGCGDGDGCGGVCTCPSGQTCRGGICESNDCAGQRPGNHACQGGQWVCTNGTKECYSGDPNCNECCGPETESPDCIGNPNGHRCPTNAIRTCGCFGLEVVRGDGRCVPCLDTSDCDKFQQHQICSPQNTCVCDTANGWQFCEAGYGTGRGCYDLLNGPEHCGVCESVGCATAVIGYPDPICRIGQCCAVPGGVCSISGNGIQCCGPGACQFDATPGIQLWRCA